MAKSTATATETSDSGIKLYNELPGGGFDPLNWPQDVVGGASSAAESAASSAAGAVWGEVEPFLAKAMLVIAGLALMGLGLFKVVSPSHSAKDGLESLGRAIGSAVGRAGQAATVAAE